MWIMEHKALTAGLVVGGFVLYKVAHGQGAAAANAANDQNLQYQGPSVIGSPGPVATLAAPGQDSTAVAGASAGGTSPLDIAAFIQGEVEKARTNANVANVASGTTTNTDLIQSFLTKINPGKLAGQQINVGYNDSGQLTHFDFNKILAPQSAVEQASSDAKVSSIKAGQTAASAKSSAQSIIDSITNNAKAAIATVKGAADIKTQSQKINNAAMVTTAQQGNALQAALNKIKPVAAK